MYIALSESDRGPFAVIKITKKNGVNIKKFRQAIREEFDSDFESSNFCQATIEECGRFGNSSCTVTTLYEGELETHEISLETTWIY